MKNTKGGGGGGDSGGTMLIEQRNGVVRRPKLGAIFRSSDPTSLYTPNHFDEDHNRRVTSGSAQADSSSSSSNNASPYNMSPYNNTTSSVSSSPYNKSPWLLPSINFFHQNEIENDAFYSQNGLIGSIVREEGHIYSLAVNGSLLYTGSESKNIRVWKDLKDFAGFKSNSGFVKTIVISDEKIYTGHQDGKIRVWKVSKKNPSSYKRVGSLPTFKEYFKSSMNPKNYVEVRRNRSVVKVKHFDAVSTLSLDEEAGLLYSGSWDKTVKVWRISDSKCLESIDAHEDAVNSVVAAFGAFVLTGAADGTVKMWRRKQVNEKKTRHVIDGILLRQENAVTALAVNRLAAVVYAASSDGLVNFWERDLKGGGLCHGGVLRGHKLAVLCLAVAGNLVFSGSADKNICVWKRDESGIHTCLSVLSGHTGPVKCLTVKEEEDRRQGQRRKGDQRWIIYTGSLDNSVKVWRVAENAPELKMIQGWPLPSHGGTPGCDNSSTAGSSPSSLPVTSAISGNFNNNLQININNINDVYPKRLQSQS
ncbi:hypothetical protein HN51_010233 [Arachis hypogaea]|uniref:protein JINGUBANG-like n=1 Tax=Arachis hypogaea TaxID=3818 RepID=UPI000DECADFE|nr:protein JINGUBANG-like [Arachis hypogaea]QHO55311.1 uncharacterized protein DS421_3g64160 [Arachis hypogaea]